MKKAIKVFSFSLILVLLISGVYRVLSWKDTTGGYLSSTQQLYATEDNLIDVVFLGSSHVYCGINPSILWDRYGISAFDMSVSGQDRDSTYHTLKEVLKTQSPQVVCIDLYGMLYDRHEVLGNEYRNMLSLRTSMNSIELVQSYAEEEDRMDYILRWPIVHTRYNELTKYDFIQYEPSIYGRGYCPTYSTRGSTYPQEAVVCEDRAVLSDSQREWLDHLIQLSNEEDFKLIMFLAPMYIEPEQQKVINAAYDYLTQYGIDTIDFNMISSEIGLDYSTDFSDATHLNKYGSDKLMAYWGEYLVSYNQLEDHRGDSDYYLWDECSKWLNHLDYANNLPQQTELTQYLNTVSSNGEDIAIIISLDGSYKESTLDLQLVKVLFSISEEEYENGGKWIFENGECVHYMPSTSTDIYTRDLSETNVLYMENSPGSLAQIRINGASQDCVNNGLTVIVYDKILHEVIDKKGFY